MNGTPSLFASSIRTLFSLVAVIGAIYFFMHILLKFSSGRGRFFSGRKGLIEVIGKLNLSPKKSIYLVRVGKKILVVGVNGGIYLLLTIEDEQIIKSLELEAENSSSGGFSRLLRNILFSTKTNAPFFPRPKKGE